MNLLKSPGKGSVCLGSSRNHKVPTLGSAHKACSLSLLAVTHGELFALLLFFLSLSSTLCPVLSFFLEPSCWQSHSLCPVLTPQQALPVLNRCSDCHLRRLLPRHPAARQAVPEVSSCWVCRQDPLRTAGSKLGRPRCSTVGRGGWWQLTAPCWGCQELQRRELDQTWGTISCGAVEWLQG